MTRADLKAQIWGRPVKPLAAGAIVALVSIGANALTVLLFGKAIITPTDDDVAIGVFAWIALGIMLISWVRRSQALFEMSLLFTMGAFFARSLLFFLVDEHPFHALLPLSIAVLTGGAFILERADAPEDGVLR